MPGQTLSESQKKALSALVKEPRGVLFHEPMSRHTTLGAGGRAEVLVLPTAEELPDVLAFCQDSGVPRTILGNGSNVLVSDKGLPGICVIIGRSCGGFRIEGSLIHAEAGCSLERLSRSAAEAGLTGLEFAEGIPGTLGGAIYMNAGAYGGQISDVLENAKVLGSDGTMTDMPAENMELSYRSSRFQWSGEAILRTRLKLRHGAPGEIREKMALFAEKRRASQPVGSRSAGSTFKRPAPNGDETASAESRSPAWKLIQDAGLRGYRVGDAVVSEKHCGFLVNEGQASASELYQLMQEVIQKVYAASGVKLQLEVQLLGEF